MCAAEVTHTKNAKLRFATTQKVYLHSTEMRKMQFLLKKRDLKFKCGAFIIAQNIFSVKPN